MNAVSRRNLVILLALSLTVVPAFSRGQTIATGRGGTILDKVGFDQKLDAQVPADAGLP